MNIFDGRKAFYQWDTNQKIRLNAPCQELHIGRGGDETTTDVKVLDSGGDYYAKVPDEILQDAAPFNAYGYVTTPDGNYTRVRQRFAVIAREKPAGYIYTPAERLTWEQLQAQIGDLGDLETEAKDSLVAAINEAAKSGGGSGGKDGTGIESITYKGEDESGGNMYTVLLTDGTSYDITAPKGAKGDKGDLGEKGADGAAGADGITPHIGDNGNWYLGTTDTGKPSRGDKGTDGSGGTAWTKIGEWSIADGSQVIAFNQEIADLNTYRYIKAIIEFPGIKNTSVKTRTGFRFGQKTQWFTYNVDVDATTPVATLIDVYIDGNKIVYDVVVGKVMRPGTMYGADVSALYPLRKGMVDDPTIQPSTLSGIVVSLQNTSTDYLDGASIAVWGLKHENL